MPPPLPESPNYVPPPVRTYLWFAAWVLPSLFFITFALMILIPRAELMLERTPMDVSGSAPFMFIVGVVRFFWNYFWLIAPFALAAIMLPELRWRNHPHLRSKYLGTMAYLINLFTLILLTLIAIVTGLLGPTLLPNPKAEQSAAGKDYISGV